MKHTILKIVSVLLLLYALLTLFLSGSVIFDLFGIRAKEGNYVPFVVWVNFISSILYLVAAYGLLKLKKWSAWVLLLAAVIILGAFIGLKFHINAGKLYETKTVSALLFRLLITIVFAASSWFLINKSILKSEKI